MNRRLLRGIGCVFAMIGVCCLTCVTTSVMSFSADTNVVAGWALAASSEGMAEDIGFVCEGSQAATFTQHLLDEHREGLTFTEVSIRTEDEGVYVLQGTLNNALFAAEFTMGDDKGFLGLVGNCISGIREIEPTSTDELPD